MNRRRRDVMAIALRIGLVVALCIDAYVGALSLLAPQLIAPLLDIPVHDPTIVRIAGGEYVVAALVYAFPLRDPVRYRAVLWLCALDQLFAVLLPALAVAHGALPATWKIVVPIPFQALLASLFTAGAARPAAPSRYGRLPR